MSVSPGRISSTGTGFKFDDHSSSGPFAFSITGPFRMSDIDDSQVRIRLVPDGRDDWTFDLNLLMRFDNGSIRNFVWRGVRLDNAEPERMIEDIATRARVSVRNDGSSVESEQKYRATLRVLWDSSIAPRLLSL